MNTEKLLSPYTLGDITLKNRIVMAPMTRSRAINNVPNELMAEYYGQRAAAGLIITEGTSPSPNGLGYARIPGLFNEMQVAGWKKVTDTVHSKDGRIFAQLMHTGRISQPSNMPDDAMIFAPSAVKAAGQMWTDQSGLQDYPVPTAMANADIERAKQEYASAAANAVKAGFDGIELHGANGYLLEQFLSPVSNRRTDGYGANIEYRSRFLLEVVAAAVYTIGKKKVGIRLSPYGVASDMPPYPQIAATYAYLAGQLNAMGILYLHIVDHSALGAPEVPVEIKKMFRETFHGTVILSGGYTMERAEKEIEGGLADCIAFGRPFINNSDLVERFTAGWPLSDNLDMKTFYTPGEKGYTDYPVHAA
jgi:N-ethylmaleimide reductase